MNEIKTHTITIGDSLQKLARLYGVEDWIDIALVNELHSPYIDSVFQSTDHLNDDGVAKIGDIIIIPNLESSKVVSNHRNEEVESLAYGIDLNLFGEENEELSFEINDIALSKGLDNLAQQLKIRLSTKKGSILLHPDFGSDLYKYTGKLSKYEDRNKIVYEVEKCLRSDFRVKEVSNIEIESKNGNNYVSATITPIEPGQPFKLYKYLR